MTATVSTTTPTRCAADVTFTSSGSPASPTTVSLVVTDPSARRPPTHQQRDHPERHRHLHRCHHLPAGADRVDGLWSYVWIAPERSPTSAGTWRCCHHDRTWYIGLDEFKDRLGITDAADDSQRRSPFRQLPSGLTSTPAGISTGSLRFALRTTQHLGAEY